MCVCMFQLTRGLASSAKDSEKDNHECTGAMTHRGKFKIYKCTHMYTECPKVWLDVVDKTQRMSTNIIYTVHVLTVGVHSMANCVWSPMDTSV